MDVYDDMVEDPAKPRVFRKEDDVVNLAKEQWDIYRSRDLIKTARFELNIQEEENIVCLSLQCSCCHRALNL